MTSFLDVFVLLALVDWRHPESGGVHMADMTESDDAVVTIIRQRPRTQHTARYEAWLKEIVPIAQGFAGHRGVNVIRPQGSEGAYTIVLHFDTIETLRGWLDSEARARLIEKVRPFLAAEESVDIKTGLEFWFTPLGQKHAKTYKQFLVTLSAIFPLTIVVPWLLRPLFGAVPFLAQPGISHLIVASIITGLMTYVIMPRYTRLISAWLYK